MMAQLTDETHVMRWTRRSDGAWVCDTLNGHALLQPLPGPTAAMGYCWQIQIETPHCIQRTVRWFINESYAQRRVEHDLAHACAEAMEAK